MGTSNLIEQLKKVRATGLPTILEGFQSPKVMEDVITSNFDGVELSMEKGQFHAFCIEV